MATIDTEPASKSASESGPVPSSSSGPLSLDVRADSQGGGAVRLTMPPTLITSRMYLLQDIYISSAPSFQPPLMPPKSPHQFYPKLAPAAAISAPTSPKSGTHRHGVSPSGAENHLSLYGSGHAHTASARQKALISSSSLSALPLAESPSKAAYERRGSVASTTSSYRVRRKAVPGDGESRYSAMSHLPAADQSGLAPLPLVRRRSSMQSSGRPDMAPVYGTSLPEESKVSDHPTSQGPSGASSEFNFSCLPARSDSPSQTSFAAQNRTCSQLSPVQTSSHDETMTEGVVKSEAEALSRPSIAPTDPAAAADALPATPLHNTIMIDGQAFVLDGDDEESEEDDEPASLSSRSAQWLKASHSMSTFASADATLPMTWSSRHIAPRHVDLSVHTRAAEERERAQKKESRPRIVQPDEVISTQQSPPTGASAATNSIFQWHRSMFGDTEEVFCRGDTKEIDNIAHVRSLVRDFGVRSNTPRRRNAAMDLVKGNGKRINSPHKHGTTPSVESKALVASPKKGTDTSKGAYAIQPPSVAALREAADLMLFTEDGDLARFGELFSPQRTLVCFLRHWFCPMCQEFAMSMKHIDPFPLRQANIGLIVIGQGDPHVISAYKRVMEVPSWIQMYADPSRRIYRALGMKMRTNDPGPACAKPDYIQMSMLKGSMKAIRKSLFELPMRSPGDLKLLGGEFILGPGVQCSFVHRMVTTRGHLDVPRILAQAGCDMSLQSSKRVDDEDCRPENVKLAVSRLKPRRNSPFKSMKQTARNFEQERRRFAGPSVDLPSSKGSVLYTSPIPTVPKLPMSASSFQQQAMQKSGDEDREIKGTVSRSVSTPTALAQIRKRVSTESCQKRGEELSRISIIMARGPQPESTRRGKSLWLSAPPQTLKRVSSVPEMSTDVRTATDSVIASERISTTESHSRAISPAEEEWGLQQDVVASLISDTRGLTCTGAVSPASSSFKGRNPIPLKVFEHRILSSGSIRSTSSAPPARGLAPFKGKDAQLGYDTKYSCPRKQEQVRTQKSQSSIATPVLRTSTSLSTLPTAKASEATSARDAFSRRSLARPSQEGKQSYETWAHGSIESTVARSVATTGAGRCSTQEPGARAFVTDLDVVDDLTLQVSPQSQSLEGNSNLNTFATYVFDGYQAPLDSWRSEDERVTMSDSEDFEHDSGWTRTTSAAEGSVISKNGRQRQQEGLRESIELTYSDYTDRMEGLDDEGFEGLYGSSSDESRSLDDPSASGSSSRASLDLFSEEPPTRRSYEKGRAAKGQETKLSLSLDAVTDTHLSDESTVKVLHQPRTAVGSMTAAAAPSLHSHTGHRFGQEDAILEEEEPSSGS